MKKKWYVYRIRYWSDNPKTVFGLSFEEDLTKVISAIQKQYEEIADVSIHYVEDSSILDGRVLYRALTPEISQMFERLIEAMYEFISGEEGK